MACTAGGRGGLRLYLIEMGAFDLRGGVALTKQGEGLQAPASDAP